MIGLQAGSEVPIHDSSGVKRLGLRIAADFDIELLRYNSSGELQETILSIDSATGVLTVNSGNLTFAAADMPANSVGQDELALTAIAGGADAAVAILNTTTRIELNSGSGAKSITTTSSKDGQRISIFAPTVSGGSYTLAVDEGTLTFDAADEAALIERVGSAWRVLSLRGATIV